MSFRELRSFTEKMRCLGYSRPISMEAFRTPNFELVADTLHWLVKSYDPTTTLLKDTSTKAGRVAFIKEVALFLAIKSPIKLNTRKLYGADGYAVKELLKLAHLLHTATTHAERDAGKVALRLEFTSKAPQIKACKALASEITEKGALLFDLLGTEITLRDIRSTILGQPFEMDHMQRAVSEAIEELVEQTRSMTTAIDHLGADEANLRAKLDKKRSEWERATKRLKSLQGVRPAYMDEYDKVEGQLVKLYASYLDKFRNLAWLEQQLEELNQAEALQAEEAQNNVKDMQARLKQEELDLLKGDLGAELEGLTLSRVDSMDMSEGEISLDEEEEASLLNSSEHVVVGGAGPKGGRPSEGKGHNDNDDNEEEEELELEEEPDAEYFAGSPARKATILGPTRPAGRAGRGRGIGGSLVAPNASKQTLSGKEGPKDRGPGAEDDDDDDVFGARGGADEDDALSDDDDEDDGF